MKKYYHLISEVSEMIIRQKEEMLWLSIFMIFLHHFSLQELFYDILDDFTELDLEMLLNMNQSKKFEGENVSNSLTPKVWGDVLSIHWKEG